MIGEIHENFIARYSGTPSRPVAVPDWSENSPRDERPVKDRSPAPPSRVAEARRDVRPAINPSVRPRGKVPESNKGKGKENNAVSSTEIDEQRDD